MFVGFNTAVRGLLVSKRGLYTTGHNIDNSSNGNYSRQIMDQRATRAHRIPGVGYEGTGTQIKSITRVRDAFTDFKYWKEMGPLGEWSVKNQSIVEIENLIGEPSENSFSGYLNHLYTSMDSMITNPGDLSYREPVIENASSFAKHVNDVSKRLLNLKEDLLENIEVKVGQINQLGSQIANINRQIYYQEITERPANDLRDERERLVDELSQIVDVSVTESPEGKYDVSIGGVSLVHHISKNEIRFEREAETEEEMLTWSNGGIVRYQSGELKGLTDLVLGDGRDNHYRGIPFYEDQIDYFAFNYAKRFNEIHREGYDLNGDKGLDFFVKGDGSFDGTEGHKGFAKEMVINKEILRDPRKLAAGGEVINGEVAAEDNRNIHKLIEDRKNKEYFPSGKDYPMGSPDDYIKSVVSSMAVDSMQTDRFLETQKLLSQNLENRRSSISGVSLNEEMTNLVKFQQVYGASARMITTLDNILDITINRFGMVGR